MINHLIDNSFLTSSADNVSLLTNSVAKSFNFNSLVFKSVLTLPYDS